MGYQDYTTYTEEDPSGDNDIKIVSPQLLDYHMVETRGINPRCCLYKDFGAGTFGDFTITLDYVRMTYGQILALIGIWAMNNLGGQNRSEMKSNNDGIGCNIYYTSGSGIDLRLEDFDNGNKDAYDMPGGFPYGPYYFTVTRAGNSLIQRVYSDAARTALLDTLSVTCTLDTYRYYMLSYSSVCCPGSGNCSGWIGASNLYLNDPPNAPNNPVPNDGATGLVPPDITLEVDVSDPNGDNMDVSFYDASDDSLICTDAGVVDGGTASCTWSGLACGLTYSWYAVADDGEDQTSSGIFTFDTQACQFQYKHPLRSKTKDRFKYKCKTDRDKYRSKKADKNYKYKGKVQR